MEFADQVDAGQVAVAGEDPPTGSSGGMFDLGPLGRRRRPLDDTPAIIRAILTGYDEA
jgi:hypothetical protein